MNILGFEVKKATKADKSVSVMDNRGSGNLPTFEFMQAISSALNSFPYANYNSFRQSAYWNQLVGLQSLFLWYQSNPILNTVINIKARESANMRIVVENINTGQIEPENTRKEIPAKIYRLIKNPNPLQTQWQWLKQRKIFRDVAGNGFTYANWPDTLKRDIRNIETLFNVWPAFMQFKLAGNYFEATQIEDIIKEWRFEYGSYKKQWNPNQILHQSESNTDPTDGLIFGIPKIKGLIKPLSNIDLCYESMNVIIKNRGMRGIISPDKSDASGKIPLSKDEKKAVEAEIKDYGTLQDQMQFFFSHMPLNYNAVDQDVRKLGIFEEIATDTKIVCHVFGVPEILVQMDLQGTTYENQESSLRRLYQGALIPEGEDDLDGLNKFLGLNETDWRLKGYWDHIPCLQKSEKEKSESNKNISIYMEKLFLIGGVTLNAWLDAIGLTKIPTGERTIFEMTPEEKEHILRALKAGSPSTTDSTQETQSTQSNSSKSKKTKSSDIDHEDELKEVKEQSDKEIKKLESNLVNEKYERKRLEEELKRYKN